MTQLLNALPGALAQGLIWGVMAIGVYITYKVLDIADLTVDGSICTGAAVCTMLLLGGQSPWLALLCAVLAGVLALVALGLPAVYFWNCAHGIKIFIQKLGLDKAAKPFYRLQLDETGLSIWMAGEQDKAAPSRQCDWHHIHLAYRTENAIYLYVHQTQAYLWNDSLDAGWEALKAHLPADRLRDLR